ncbi:MAG: hypothetical protein FWD74_10935, partial [Actinomycetia bacterium]|nr:hypothetical protein [Actinomycetes bacterium]
MRRSDVTSSGDGPRRYRNGTLGTLSHRAGRRMVSAVVAGAMVLASVVLAMVISHEASAALPFPINDPTNGPAGTVDPLWQYVRTGNTVGNTYTSDGWLRLTSAGNAQGTNILNNTAFPSSTGFEVSFDYRQAGGTAGNGSTLTADGISMYLVDGSVSVTAGSAGSGLGYANGGDATNLASVGLDGVCRSAAPPSHEGVYGGYLGLGLDVFGNYASNNFGNYGGSNMGPGIGLRGSGPSSCLYTSSSDLSAANRSKQYPWVNGKAMDLWTGTAGDTNDPANVSNSKYRRVSITVNPQGSNLQVTVAMSGLVAKGSPPGPLAQVFTSNLNSVQGQVALPKTLKLGFAASTGSGTDYHDIRNIRTSALTDASIAKMLSAATPGHAGYPEGTFLPGDPISFTLTAKNNGPSPIGDPPDGVARIYDDLSGLPITGVSWTCAASPGAACKQDGGTGSQVIQDWSGPVGSTVTVTVSGTVTNNPGPYGNTAVIPTEFVTNTVDPSSSIIQLDGGAADPNLLNNKATANFTVQANPSSLSVTKSTSTASVANVGDKINYSFTVQNTGLTAVTGIHIVDHPTAPAKDLDAPGATCAATTLAAGASTTCTGTYTVAQADIDAGAVADTANAIGLDPNNDPVDSGPSNEVRVPITGAPALTVAKSADRATVSNLGDKINYEFLVTNTGNVTLHGVNVTDTQSLSGAALDADPVCDATTLASGASTTCRASYTVVQGDMDAGTVGDTAIAHGTAPGAADETDSGPSSVTVGVTYGAALSVVKSSSTASVSAVGDKVDYTFVVRNTGNVTLTGVGVVDHPVTPAGPLDAAPVCDATTLAPSASTTCRASYTVTQDDLDAGSVKDTAVAQGNPPGGGSPVGSDPSNEVDVPVTGRAPGLSVVKSSSTTSVSAVGDKVDYTFVVTNTGNVTLSGITVEDRPVAPASALDAAPNCPVTTLKPGASTTCTASYTVTQDDLDAGGVKDTAVAHGNPPGGGSPVDSDPSGEVDVPVTSGPALSVVKSADRMTVSNLGDKINYEFLVTNTGNVTLHGVNVTDTQSLSGAALDA